MSVLEEEPASHLKSVALAYAARGWHVVPLYPNTPTGCGCGSQSCDSPGKHPIPNTGLNAATNATDDVDYYWDKWPTANIGIVAGPSGLAIVDVDSLEAANRWKTLHPDLAQTYTVKTGRGYHLYYSDPTGAEAPCVGRDSDAGIDLRAGGSYVVAPPSTHYSGSAYELLRDVAIRPLPLQVQAYFAARRKTRSEPVEDGATITSGGRDNYLASIAGTMRSVGMTRSELEAALLRVNTDRVEPPLDERDVRRIAKSVASYPPGAPDLLTISTFGVIEADTTEEPGSSWTPINLNERAANPPAPPSIGGCLYEAKRHVLSGEPESGKSWLALAWCVEELKAGRYVAYIDHEMGAGMTKERLHALGATNADVDRFLYLDPTEQIEQGLDAIQRALDQYKPRLVIIDSTIGNLTLHGYDPNVGKDIELWYHRVVNRFTRAGAAVVVLDHVTKNQDTRGKFAIGSERKTGIADVHLSARIIQTFGRDREGRAEIRVQKDRPGHLTRPILGTFTVDSSLPGVSAYTWHPHDPASTHTESGAFRPTGLMEKVSRELEAHGPLSLTQIRSKDHVGGKAEYVTAAIHALTEEGHIEKRPKGGTTGHEIVSIKPFRDVAVPAVPSRSLAVPGTANDSRSQIPVGDWKGTARGAHLERLAVPCPICKATQSEQPYHAHGGTYCCEPCAQGDACVCRYDGHA